MKDPNSRSAWRRSRSDAEERVRGLIERFRAPLQLTRFSSMMHLIVPPEFKHGGLVFSLLRERGIHIWENRVFMFTSAHTDADVDRLVAAFEESLEEMADAGFITTVREPAALALKGDTSHRESGWPR